MKNQKWYQSPSALPLRARAHLNCLMAFLALTTLAHQELRATEPVAIFHVGNSLTDQAYGMHDIAKAREHGTLFGRHMIPGASLNWLWEHRGEGFRQPDAKKPADEILRERKWDVLILQPFGSPVQVEPRRPHTSPKVCFSARAR